MKFCKNLQRVADLSNPEWSPYFTDYKRLKKVIKKLSDLDVGTLDEKTSDQEDRNEDNEHSERKPIENHILVRQVSSGELSSTQKASDEGSLRTTTTSSSTNTATSTTGSGQASADCPQQNNSSGVLREPVATLKRSPGEILFFKLLHFEFQKAVHFFDRVIEEFRIREERVVETVDIIKHGNRSQLWSGLTKSVYRLYSDLLLLESFCIMTYCSFSKILKKHDKVTGFDTRDAFMSNVVNNANFTNYTTLQEMITRCERLYSEASERIIQEGCPDLFEDERLFIEMVYQLNQEKT